MKNNPQLTLIGAGPGDPELITLKGLRCLQTADVILYDALVNTELLNYADTPHKIFVGKRSGHHEKSQATINKLIVDYARNFGHVVRLKGGDPFVFGRGSEEIEFAERNGIPAGIIPGVTSAIAVPALYNIPVTRREESESFWVMTGTARKGILSGDLQIAAGSTATLVILMGLKRINEIISVLIKAGRSRTPAAIIEQGSLPGSGIITGVVETIADNENLKHVKGPALIIIGEVVKHAKKLNNVVEKYAESRPSVREE